MAEPGESRRIAIAIPAKTGASTTISSVESTRSSARQLIETQREPATAGAVQVDGIRLASTSVELIPDQRAYAGAMSARHANPPMGQASRENGARPHVDRAAKPISVAGGNGE